MTDARALLVKHWNAFCDCDSYPDNFVEDMEAAGLAELRGVTEEDLEAPFAFECGIRAGGMVWVLTAAGEKAFEDARRAA